MYVRASARALPLACVCLLAICGSDVLFVCVCDSDHAQKVKLRQMLRRITSSPGGKRFAGGRVFGDQIKTDNVT